MILFGNPLFWYFYVLHNAPLLRSSLCFPCPVSCQDELGQGGSSGLRGMRRCNGIFFGGGAEIQVLSWETVWAISKQQGGGAGGHRYAVLFSNKPLSPN